MPEKKIKSGKRNEPENNIRIEYPLSAEAKALKKAPVSRELSGLIFLTSSQLNFLFCEAKNLIVISGSHNTFLTGCYSVVLTVFKLIKHGF